jgi:phage terminase large subunit-like protein
LDDRTSDYARAVLSGEIVAGPHVRNACRRHLDDLERGEERGLWFDRDKAEEAFRYFETVLKLSEGQFEGQPFILHPSQAFIVGSLFGWMREDGTRRFRRAYIEQGKGNGKSPLAGGIGLKGLASDGEAGAQIYAAAAKREQAGILFADAVKMVKQSPALAKRLSLSGGPGREFNIAHLSSGSFFRPVSKEAGKSGSGPRPYFVLADEVHEMPDRKILEMMERGFKFRRQPLLFMITNSGTDRNSVAWEEHEHAVKVAAGNHDAVTDPTYQGQAIDDTTFAYVCALDEDDDPLEDPSCWAKANPLLGVTITEQYLADTVKQARAIPGQLNGILRLHFCVWTDAETAWMSRDALEPRLADFDIADHHGAKIYLALDLSQNQDITALGAVVETGTIDGKPTYDAWIEAWTPGDTMAARGRRDKLPYDVWAREGHLHAPKGKTISYRHVAQTLAEYDRDFHIQLVAYDRFAFKKFEEDVIELGLSIPFAEHPQGGTRKGKALAPGGEGLWFPGSLRLLENAILEGRVRFKRNPVLISAMMSAVTDQDKWDNRWLAKERSVNKIDAAVAVTMALGVANTADQAPAPGIIFL